MVNKADFTPPLQPSSKLPPDQSPETSNPIEKKTVEIAATRLDISTNTPENLSSLSVNAKHLPKNSIEAQDTKIYDKCLNVLINRPQENEISNTDDLAFEVALDESDWGDEEQEILDIETTFNDNVSITENSSFEDAVESATEELEDKVEEETKADEAVNNAVRKEDTTNEALASLNDAIAETTKKQDWLSAEIDNVVIDPRFANFDKEQIKDELKATQVKFQELANLLEEFMVKGETITTKDGKEIVVFKKATAEEVAKNPENCALLKDGKLVCHTPGSRDMRALTEDQAAELRKKYGSLDKVPESEFPTARAMNSEESAELHSIIKEYRALSDKMSLLESLLLNHVENEKPHESKSHETHAKASESAPRTETVHVEEKPVADDKDDAKAKKTDRFIMPDFSTSAQRKKERLRQDKQDEEDKQITRDAIKRKNESYRQDQERIQDDFIKKSDLSLKRKSADRQKKTP
jgi:hypothetical protein